MEGADEHRDRGGAEGGGAQGVVLLRQAQEDRFTSTQHFQLSLQPHRTLITHLRGGGGGGVLEKEGGSLIFPVWLRQEYGFI